VLIDVQGQSPPGWWAFALGVERLIFEAESFVLSRLMVLFGILRSAQDDGTNEQRQRRDAGVLPLRFTQGQNATGLSAWVG
jgi:hypothetical protein